MTRIRENAETYVPSTVSATRPCSQTGSWAIVWIFFGRALVMAALLLGKVLKGLGYGLQHDATRLDQSKTLQLQCSSPSAVVL